MKPSPRFDRVKKKTRIIFDEIKCPLKEEGGVIKNDKLLRTSSKPLASNIDVHTRSFFLNLNIRRIINCNRIVFIHFNVAKRIRKKEERE